MEAPIEQHSESPTPDRPNRRCDWLRFSPKFVLAVVLVQIATGCAYILKVPLWMPSDERAHMLYVKDLLRTGRLHVIVSGDTHYESVQPPFYYVCAAIVSRTFAPNSDLERQGLVLRSFGLSLYVLSSLLVFALFRRLSGHLPFLSLTAAASYALCPTLHGIYTTVTNDSLSFLLTALVFFLLSGLSRGTLTFSRSGVIGIVCGLGLITKTTFLPVALVAAIYLLVISNCADRFRCLASFCVPVIVLLAPWLIWNLQAYGELQPYGSVAHFLVHGPLCISNVNACYSSIASFVSYHVLPSEFWLNQFQTPYILRALCVILILAAGVGTAAAASNAGFRGRAVVISSLGYFPLIAFWLCITLAISVEPVRGFLGGYFGFCYLAVSGSTYVARLIWRSDFTAQCSALFFPVAFVITNLYLIFWKIPALVNFGLYPR